MTQGKDVLLVTTDLLGNSISGLLQGFQTQHPSLEIHIIPNNSSPSSLPSDILIRTKYIIGFNNFPEPSLVPNLSYVQLFSAGSNHLHSHPLWNDTTNPSVKWCSASGVHGPIIAEYVIMAILTHQHRYLSSIQSFQRVGHWPVNWPGDSFGPRRELYGKTVGIVGYGAIGRNIARLLTGFGVSVVTLNSTRKVAPEEKRQRDDYTVPGTGDVNGEIPMTWYSSSDKQEKAEFFKRSDIVVVTAPFTPTTKHLINCESLKQMKPTSLLINIARGELIDQEALVTALQTHEIGGVALDVFTPEPYPSTGPLLTFNSEEDLDRVILTPHISGHTDQYALRIIDILTQNFHRLQHKLPLLNLINKTKGVLIRFPSNSFNQ